MGSTGSSFLLAGGVEDWKEERGTHPKNVVRRDEANDGGLSEGFIGKSGTDGTEFPWRLSVRLLYMDG